MAGNMQAIRCMTATAAACMAMILRGQTCEEFPLRPPDPAAKEPVAERVLFYPRGGDDRGLHRVVFDVAVPTLTVYRPAPEKNRGAAFVLCPGGAYHGVVIDREGHWVARYFQNLGYTVAVLKYRMPKPAEAGAGGELPRSQQDALEAIRHVRTRAAEWGVDAGLVGIMGSSAGGHLAGSTAFLGNGSNGTRPDFVALLYPVVSMGEPIAHAGSRRNLLGPAPTPAQVERFSLEKQVRSGMPPFFIVHARDDDKVPVGHSRLLAGALERAGVPVKLIIYETGGHGFSLGRGPPSDGWKDAFVAWLAGVVK